MSSNPSVEFWVRTPELHLANMAFRHLRYLLEFDPQEPRGPDDPDGFDYRKLVARLMRNSVHDIDEISAVSDFIRLQKLPKVCQPRIQARMESNPRREEYLAQVYALEALLQDNSDYKRLPSSNAILISFYDDNSAGTTTIYENAGPRNELPEITRTLFNGGLRLSSDRIVTHQDEEDSEHSVSKATLLKMMRIEAYQGDEANMQLFSKLRAHERARFVLAAFKKGESHLKEARKRLASSFSDVVDMTDSVRKSTSNAEATESIVEHLEVPPRQSGTHSSDSSTSSTFERLPVLDNQGRPIEEILPSPSPASSIKSKSTSPVKRPPHFSVYRNTKIDKNIGALFFVVKLAEMSGELMNQIMRIRMDRLGEEDADIELSLESPFDEFTFSRFLPSPASGYKLKVNFDATKSGPKAEMMRFKTLVGLLTLYELIEQNNANETYLVLFASEKPLADNDNTTTYIAEANRAVASAFNEEFNGNNLVIYSFKGSFQLVAKPQKLLAKGVGAAISPTKRNDDESDVISVIGKEKSDDGSDSEYD